MHNPFAIAVQWPDDPRRYLVHLQRPYFTAALYESTAGTWLALSWCPNTGPELIDRATLFRAAADFCRIELGRSRLPMEFVERQVGYSLPQFLMARSSEQLYIVEPEHATPLVEVREGSQSPAPKNKMAPRYDVITEWRLSQMRRYYQQFLERQNSDSSKSLAPNSMASAKK